jgi:thioredoxin-related protein
MRFIILFLVAAVATSFAQWQPDFPTAQKIAKEEGKLILLNFSGSDWCGPCIRLRKEVLDSETFGKMADSSLVLFNADFPRNKKNQLPKEVQRRNDALADQYNPLGKFPFTLLLTAEGKVIRSWEGYPQNNSELFIEQVKLICDANRR